MFKLHDVRGDSSAWPPKFFDSPNALFAGVSENDPSQPFADLVVGGMFMAFLMLFVLIGIFPALQKTFARLRAYWKIIGTPESLDRHAIKLSGKVGTAASFDPPQLNQYEVFVLRSLAHSRHPARSLRSISEALQLELVLVERSLQSLHQKRLVLPVSVPILGTYYFMTRQGREYSVAQGFYPFPYKRF